jgi:hypothetical protein
MDALESFDRAQAQGQAGGLRERAFVVLVNLGLGQCFDELLVFATFHLRTLARCVSRDKRQKARPGAKEDDDSAREAEQLQGNAG